jgi:hypothetical protein
MIVAVPATAPCCARSNEFPLSAANDRPPDRESSTLRRPAHGRQTPASGGLLCRAPVVAPLCPYPSLWLVGRPTAGCRCHRRRSPPTQSCCICSVASRKCWHSRRCKAHSSAAAQSFINEQLGWLRCRRCVRSRRPLQHWLRLLLLLLPMQAPLHMLCCDWRQF